MRNIIYNYSKRTKDQFIVQDFTSVYFGALNLTISSYPEYFTFIDVNNDEKLENISYQLYGSEDYADVILACNQENFLWSMPYNQDVLLEYSDRIMEAFKNELNIKSENKDFEELKASIEHKIDDINSQKQRWRVPREENISDVISLINSYKENNNDTSWRLGYYE